MRPPRSRDLAAALAAAAVCALAPAGAAAERRSEIGELDLEGLLDHSLAAASLREERSSDAAASVFVLEGDDLRRQGFSTVAEALASVPGLFGFRDGFNPYIGVRGVGLLGDFTTRLLVLVDGHPVNDALGMGASHVGRDLPVVLDAVQRIEVVKGPVGGVYGPTAFLGVVNVVTQDARPRAIEARATGELAQGRARTGRAAAVATAIVGDVEVLLAADGEASRGLDWTFPELAAASDRPPPPGGRVEAMGRSGAFSAQARLERGGLRVAAACSGATSGLPSAPYSSRLLDRRSRLEARSCFADVASAHALSPGLTIVGRGAYDWVDVRDALAYDEPPASVGLVHDVGTDRWWSGELRIEWEPGPALRVVAGGRAESHATLQRSWSDAVPTVHEDPDLGVGVGDIRRDFGGGGAFLLVDQVLPGSVTLHADLALSLHEVYGARLTSKAAAVWRPDAATAVKLVLADGFRPPLASEAFFEDGIDFLPNPDLRPETVRSLELSAERRLGRYATAAASVFRNHYLDLVRIAAVPAPGLGRPPDQDVPADWRQMPMNVGHEDVEGAEVSANVRWRERVRAWGGVSVQRAEHGTLENFPTVTANLAVSTRIGSALVLSARGGFVSGRAKPPEALADGARPRVPWSAVLDATATIELSRPRGLSLQLAVTNLTDASAPSPLPGDFVPLTEHPAAARTFRASLRGRTW